MGLAHTRTVREFFDRQSGMWTSQYESGFLAERAERFLEALRRSVPPGAAILDIGCGTGDITRAVAGNGWNVTACDLSPKMIAAAKSHRGSDTVTWVSLSDATVELPFPDSTFGAVYSSSVLEYVDAPERHIAEVVRVLAPGGLYLASVPDMRHPTRVAEKWKRGVAMFGPTMALLHLTRWGPSYEYLRTSINRWDIEQWRRLLQTAGFVPAEAPSCDHPLALLAAQKAPA